MGEIIDLNPARSAKPAKPARSARSAKPANCRVLRLHLELHLDVSRAELAVLKKYGKLREGISRDVLVPEEMQLSHLHCAIQRAFGWQNSHLHSFSYPQPVTEALLQDDVRRWFALCGLYFPFPLLKEDWEEDEDWEEELLRPVSKGSYSPPYFYYGDVAHYFYAQSAAQVFWQENEQLDVFPSFEEFCAGKTQSKKKPLEQVTLEELGRCLEADLTGLLERLPLGQVLGLRAAPRWQQRVEQLITEAESSFDRLSEQTSRLLENIDGLDDLDSINSIDELLGIDGIDRSALLRLMELCRDSDPAVIPLANRLIYEYDFGDGWRVDITCTGAYAQATEAGDDELQAQLAAVLETRRPLCIAADGLPLLDDVGGIGGYCAFLQALHGEDPEAEPDDVRDWAREQGWSGRLRQPQNIL